MNLSPIEFDFEGRTHPGDKRLQYLTELPPGISELTALQRLDLDGTQVADIAPIANLKHVRLFWFKGIPACDTDSTLAAFAEIEDNRERTRRTLAYLRGEPDSGEGVEEVEDDDCDDDLPHDLPDGLPDNPIDDPTSQPPDETARFHGDEPAVEDLLNRRAVAETLGTIVDEVWTDARDKDAEEQSDPNARPEARDRTFIVHLHGRWGSGKTSILNFLREVLLSGKIAKPRPQDEWLHKDPDPPWVVVDYNAWRNQKLGPAWWSLMDTVYRGAADQLGGWKTRAGFRVAIGHLFWRLRARWLEYAGVLAMAVAIVLIAIAIDAEKDWQETAKNTGAVIAVIVGAIALLNRLSIGTARTAKQYMELTRDPVNPLIGRYREMIRQIRRPVAVFIDDLDRCDAKFVVELLQTIQTMFRQAQVLYVVAADRDWICASYEQVYDPYREPIAEPGHSLGHMFLEKIFQLFIEVPTLTGDQRDAFLSELVRDKNDELPRENRADIETEVDQELEQATTEAEVIDIYDKHAKLGPRRAAIAGARAFHRMQSKELRAEREHFLEPYAKYLDANPRAMKRLLNAYGFRRGFDIQARNRSDRDALVRWTIHENRWPLLARYLMDPSNRTVGATAMEALTQRPEVRDVAKDLTHEKLSPIVGAPSTQR